MFDVKAVEKEAAEELACERASSAKGKIKASLKRIADAETVLANARRDHEVLMREIGADV